MAIQLNGTDLNVEQLWEIAVRKSRVALGPRAVKKMTASRALVERWLSEGETVYGVTTGFGEFANVRIDIDRIEELQENLILSHAAGAGEPLPREIVRAMMALRVNALAKGFSGIRVATVHTLCSMVNADIIPVIPSQGSVGASGDLVQLAHLVLAMLGRGNVWRNDGSMESAGKALKRSRIAPVKLTAKEGLALINGTQMMTSYAALAVHRSLELVRIADIAAAVSVEALRGSDTPFDARIHAVRPYVGQMHAATPFRTSQTKWPLRSTRQTTIPSSSRSRASIWRVEIFTDSRWLWPSISSLSHLQNSPIFPNDGRSGLSTDRSAAFRGSWQWKGACIQA